jgi:micrococcal nuclease
VKSLNRNKLTGLILSLILVAILAVSCTQTPLSQTPTYNVTPASAAQTQQTTARTVQTPAATPTIIFPSILTSTKPSTPLSTTTRPTTTISTTYPPTSTLTTPTTPTTKTTTPTTSPTTAVITTTPTTTTATVGEAIVVSVTDGDTIKVNIGGKIYEVRYIGIDTPETYEPFYKEAAIKNADLVSGKNVRLVKDVSEIDKYGRLLRHVYVGDLFVNAELVRLGYAEDFACQPDIKYQTTFTSLEQQAKVNLLGIWKKYVGSKNRDKYHFPNCTWAKQISSENQVRFYSVADAQSKGYVPCGVCKPPTTD